MHDARYGLEYTITETTIIHTSFPVIVIEVEALSVGANFIRYLQIFTKCHKG